MKQEFSAGVVIYHQTTMHRTYLLLRYAAGHWDFPKGHIEKGETKQKAALRELWEETGLEVALECDFEHSFTYCFKHTETHEPVLKEVYFFVGHSEQKKITLSHEHSAYAWFTYQEALDQLTYKNAKDLLIAVEAWLQCI